MAIANCGEYEILQHAMMISLQGLNFLCLTQDQAANLEEHYSAARLTLLGNVKRLAEDMKGIPNPTHLEAEFRLSAYLICQFLGKATCEMLWSVKEMNPSMLPPTVYDRLYAVFDLATYARIGYFGGNADRSTIDQTGVTDIPQVMITGLPTHCNAVSESLKALGPLSHHKGGLNKAVREALLSLNSVHLSHRDEYTGTTGGYPTRGSRLLGRKPAIHQRPVRVSPDSPAK
jgi:hypothetical protein